MKYLLDTCVLSELVKKEPSKKIVNWILEVDENSLFISVLSIGEIHKGIEKLPVSRRKATLHKWVTHDLESRFLNRILDFDLKTAALWGRLQAKSELQGTPMPAIDGQIAATGVFHDLTVVTRNASDMQASGVLLYNPWEEIIG